MSEWFVDSVAGNDANTGLSQAQAFKTLAKLQTVLGNDDTVNLKKGSHWREQLTITEHGVAIWPYGSGADPLIDGSVVGTGWTKTGGYTYVYQITITPAWGTGTNFMKVFEDNEFLALATSIANCDATAGSYYPSGSTGTITLYVHASDDGNPSTNGKTYEYSHYANPLDSYSAQDLHITGVHTRRNLHSGGSLRLGRDALAKDCRASQGGAYNVYMRAGGVLDGCMIDDVYYSATAALVTYNEDTPAGQAITIRDCDFSMSWTTGMNWGQTIGVTGHYNVSGNFGTILVDTCTFSRVAKPIADLRHATIIQVLDCEYIDCKMNEPIPSAAGPGCTILFEGGWWTSSVADQRAYHILYATAPLTIENMTIYMAAPSDIGFIAVRAAATVEVSGVTFSTALTSGVRIAVYSESAGADLTLNWNTWAVTESGSYGNRYSFTAGAAGMTWASDYNTFHPTTFSMNIFGTTYTDLEDYQDGTGQDAHSSLEGTGPMTQKLEELRTALAKAVARLFEGTASDAGTITTLVDTDGLPRFTETDALAGALLYISDTTDDLAPEGEAAFIEAYNATSNTLTLYTELSAATGAGDKYEIYLAPLDLEQWDQCINDAIRGAWPDLFTTDTEDISPTGALAYALSANADRILGAEITFKSDLAGYPSQPLPQWYAVGSPGALTLKLSRPVPMSSNMKIRVLTGQKFDELGAGQTTALDAQYVIDAGRVQFYQRMADASRQSDRGGFLQLMAHWQEKAEQRRAELAAAQMGYQPQAPRKERK